MPVADRQLVGDDLGLVGALDRLGLHALGDAEQARHREAPDVGVEHADGVAVRGERGGEVDGDRALADAALAAGDREDLAGERDLGVGAVVAGVPAGLDHDLGALLGGHLAPVDAHVGDAGVQPDPRFDLALDVGAQRAAADRQLDADVDAAVVADRDMGHHAERHDVGAELGVDHVAEHGHDLVVGGRAGRRSSHASILPAKAV